MIAAHCRNAPFADDLHDPFGFWPSPYEVACAQYLAYVMQIVEPLKRCFKGGVVAVYIGYNPNVHPAILGQSNADYYTHKQGYDLTHSSANVHYQELLCATCSFLSRCF